LAALLVALPLAADEPPPLDATGPKPNPVEPTTRQAL
jgi:hypothetical protein